MLLFNVSLHGSSTVFITDFNTSHVIIQRDYLDPSSWKCSFQYIPCYYSTAAGDVFANVFTDFNTSHVIIQPMKNRHSYILLIYINIDFKPFLSCFTNYSIDNQLFARSHVFTPFGRLFQKITW